MLSLPFATVSQRDQPPAWWQLSYTGAPCPEGLNFISGTWKNRYYLGMGLPLLPSEPPVSILFELTECTLPQTGNIT